MVYHSREFQLSYRRLPHPQSDRACGCQCLLYFQHNHNYLQNIRCHVINCKLIYLSSIVVLDKNKAELNFYFFYAVDCLRESIVYRTAVSSLSDWSNVAVRKIFHNGNPILFCIVTL